MDAVAAGYVDRSAVERQLSAAERIEWIGRPDPAVRFSRADVFLIPFSIMWFGFALFWEGAAIASDGGPFVVVWGIPFIAVGSYFAVGRFFYKAYRKRRTLYAVTNRRVLTVFTGRRGEAVNTSYIRAIPSISTHVDANGRGSVEFTRPTPYGGWYGNTGMEFLRGGAVNGVAFYDVDDPRGVADLVERLQASDPG
jgi:hypothetical protein